MASNTDKAPYKAWLAQLEQVMTRRQIATAMREYVRAHPHLWEPDDDPDTVGRWKKGSSAVKADVLANNVGRWTGGSVPGPNILKLALISVVEEAVPEVPDSVRRRWPGQWEEFADALKAADTSNRSGQKRGGAAAKRKAQLEHVEKTANVVRAAGRPDDIDPAKNLALGSSLFDDALPPYVARTADSLIATRLANPRSTPITVIVGPPKSGKTRSLFHLLSAITPQPVTWWHNPAPGAVDTLITRLQAVKNDPARPDVVILDDAGYNGVTPDTGLTAPRIRKIASLTTSVVLVVHSADLASWRDHATGGRSAGGLESMLSIGATPALVNLLEANAVDVAAELDDTELAAASQMLTDNTTHDFHGLDLSRLAEAMATVDKLRAAALTALTEGGMRAALVEAAIDATITDPAGADIDWLQTLTEIHYRRLAGNARWKPAQFDTEFDDWATAGFSPGSPHAILIRTNLADSEDDRYRLLDALIPALRSPERAVDHIAEKANCDQLFSVGQQLYQQGRLADANSWWTQSWHQGNTDAAVEIGRLLFTFSLRTSEWLIVDGFSAADWFARAWNGGNTEAAFILGLIAEWLNTSVSTTTTDAALTGAQWWAIAASHRHGPAAYNLGGTANYAGTAVEDVTGVPRTDVEWFVDAAHYGYPYAALSLGDKSNNIGVAISDGNGVARTAVEWWLLAWQSGVAEAAAALGSFASDTGTHVVDHAGIARTAVDWWLLAVHYGNPYSDNASRPETRAAGTTIDYAIRARSTVARPGSMGHNRVARAAYNIGVLAQDSGTPIADHAGILHTDVDWWVLAAHYGDEVAAYAVGIRAHSNQCVIPDQAGRDLTDVDWWVVSAELGNADAAYQLGVRARQVGKSIADHTAKDLTDIEWWVRAADMGSGGAGFKLGARAHEIGSPIPDHTGRPRTATEWWVYAAHHGHILAACNVGLEAAATNSTVADFDGVARTSTDWWVAAAGNGSAHGAYYLATEAAKIGKPITDHLGVTRTANDWLILAADRGHEDAAHYLSLAAQNAKTSISNRTAMEWAVVAANNGHADDALMIGLQVRETGIAIDGRDETSWWALAAHHGNANGAYLVGVHAYTTDSRIEDHSGRAHDAIEWWVMGAHLGSADAAFAIGHESGVSGRLVNNYAGSARTHVQWWVLAANLGHADASYRLFEHARSNDVAVDDQIGNARVALEWLYLAAELGHIKATLYFESQARQQAVPIGGRSASEWRAHAAKHGWRGDGSPPAPL